MFDSRTSESKVLIVDLCNLLTEINLNQHLKLQISNNVLNIILLEPVYEYNIYEAILQAYL
jgi:hypothetical protein